MLCSKSSRIKLYGLICHGDPFTRHDIGAQRCHPV